MTDVKAPGGMRCPRCGDAVAVGSNHHIAAQFGLIGALISLLMTSYACPKCGPIPFAEFPQEVRDKVRGEFWLGFLIIILVLAALIAVIVYFATR